jgi:hypothetical protein
MSSSPSYVIECDRSFYCAPFCVQCPTSLRSEYSTESFQKVLLLRCIRTNIGKLHFNSCDDLRSPWLRSASPLKISVTPVIQVTFCFPLTLQANLGLGRLHDTSRFTSVTTSRTVGRAPWACDQLLATPLPVHEHRKKYARHKHQTSMPEAEFEHTITASERAKIFHATEHLATVTGRSYDYE